MRWLVSGEIGNARAVICLAEGDPAGALAAVRDVLDGTAPVIGYVTVVEAQVLAGLAWRELGDQHAANQAAERALALAEADRLVLPFVMTGSREFLEALPRHQTAHAALLTDILDLMHGASRAARDQHPYPQTEGLSPCELRVLRYLPTNPVPAGDRHRTVGVAEHRQHAHPQHLRQARYRRSLRGGPPCPRVAAPLNRPHLALPPTRQLPG